MKKARPYKPKTLGSQAQGFLEEGSHIRVHSVGRDPESLTLDLAAVFLLQPRAS